MSEHKAISGYELVRNIFSAFSDDPVKKIIEITGGETEYLEFKGSCIFDPNYEKPREDEANPKEDGAKAETKKKKVETNQDLSWNIAREIFALHNTKGGVLLIGVDDKKPFAHVPLRDFDKFPPNDYLDAMVVRKIFPSDFKWAPKQGSETFQCDPQKASAFIRESFHPEYVKYGGNTVVALFVEPAQCMKGACIQVKRTKHNERPYNELYVRKPGYSGGVEAKTLVEEITSYQESRHRIDVELGRIWEKWAPTPCFSSPRTRKARKAVDGNPADVPDCDPVVDPLTKAIEGEAIQSIFAPDQEFFPEQEFNSYRIIRKIGQGAMGAVYEVENTALKVRRAIKVFTPEEATDLLKRKFLTEARLLSMLNHPGLVKVHALGKTKGVATLYYEMDLVLSSKGCPRTLEDVYRDMLERQSPTDTELRKWFAQLCLVLHYLHRNKVYHRDIKLSNILLNPRGMVILSDFGVSRIADAECRKALGDSMSYCSGTEDAPVGTAEYLAPEIVKGDEQNPNWAKVDNYALGVVFFKLLTGERYTGEHGSALQKALKGRSRFWRRVLPKLLAHSPERRIEDLTKYAIRENYPKLGLAHVLNKFLLIYVIASLAFIWLVTRCFIPENPSQAFSAIRASLTDAVPADAAADDPGNPSSDGNNTTSCATAEPSAADEDRPFVGISRRRTSARVDLRMAERDLRLLNNAYLLDKPHAVNPDGSDTFKINPAIERIHADIFKVWKETKELTNLGMQIAEVVTSRRDLVEQCAKIRQDATRQLNEIIASADYKKALSFYTAVNNEFRNCNFTEIPRPSFTPSGR